MHVANDVSSVQLVYNTTFQLPNSAALVGVQAASNGSLVIVLEDGTTGLFDVSSGKVQS